MQSSTFTVDVAATAYVSSSNVLTLTSNQALSFRLTRTNRLVQITVFLLAACVPNCPANASSGSVTSLAIDGSNVATTTAGSLLNGFTTAWSGQLTQGTHVMQVSLTGTYFPLIHFVGDTVSPGSLVLVQGPASTVIDGTSAWVPASFTGTLGIRFALF